MLLLALPRTTVFLWFWLPTGSHRSISPRRSLAVRNYFSFASERLKIYQVALHFSPSDCLRGQAVHHLSKIWSIQQFYRTKFVSVSNIPCILLYWSNLPGFKCRWFSEHLLRENLRSWRRLRPGRAHSHGHCCRQETSGQVFSQNFRISLTIYWTFDHLQPFQSL